VHDALCKKVARSSDSFDALELVNTAWALARLIVRDDPLFDAIASSALTRIKEVVHCSPHALLWSLWTTGRDELFWHLYEDCITIGYSADAAASGLLCMAGEWQGDPIHELRCIFGWGCSTRINALWSLLL